MYFLYCMLTEHLVLKYFWRTIFLASYCFAENMKDCDNKHFIMSAFFLTGNVFKGFGGLISFWEGGLGTEP